MKRKVIIGIAVGIVLVGICLLLYPTIEIQTSNQMIAFRYTDYIDEFETELSSDERYGYYAEKDVSVNNYQFHKFWFFHVITMDYIDGNYCETQYQLEESYIKAFVEHAEITENDKGVDIAKLIEGKTAVVGNTRYSRTEHDAVVYYILNGKEEVLYVYYSDELLVIQVGDTDEGPRYIAYR
jgi:hypothetical protein